MANITNVNLSKMTTLAGGQMSPKGASAPKAQLSQESINQSIDKLMAEGADRREYTRTHLVDKLVVATDPNSARMDPNAVGTIAIDAASAATRLARLQEQFKQATGYKETSSLEAQAGEVIDMAAKYPRLASMEMSRKDWDKVEAIRRELFEELPVNPMKEYVPFRPEKHSYSVKGVQMDGQFYGMKTLASIIYYKAALGLYTRDSVVNGAPIEEATYFTAAAAKKNNSSRKKNQVGVRPQANTTATQKQNEKWEAVARVFNKNRFIEKDFNNVIILFPTLDPSVPNAYKKVNAKAMIQVATTYKPGQEQVEWVEASFKYPEIVSEENTQVTGTGEANSTPKLKVFKLGIKVDVLATTAKHIDSIDDETFNREFAGAKGATSGTARGKEVLNFLDEGTYNAALKGKAKVGGGVINNKFVELVTMAETKNPNFVNTLINPFAAAGVATETAEPEAAKVDMKATQGLAGTPASKPQVPADKKPIDEK